MHAYRSAASVARKSCQHWRRVDLDTNARLLSRPSNKHQKDKMKMAERRPYAPLARFFRGDVEFSQWLMINIGYRRHRIA